MTVQTGPDPAATMDVSDPQPSPATAFQAQPQPPGGSSVLDMLAEWMASWAEEPDFTLPPNMQVALIPNPSTPLQFYYNNRATWYNDGFLDYPFTDPAPWKGPPGGATLAWPVRQPVTPTDSAYLGPLNVPSGFTGTVLSPYGPYWGANGLSSGVEVREFWHGIEYNYYGIPII
jgi:hypothetical protein